MSPNTKRGIAIPWNFDPADFALYQEAINAGKISWLSNWEMWKPQGLPANITYIPHCRTAKEAPQIMSYLSKYRDDTQVVDFMGFNEPDIKTQANMSVDHAVNLWREHVLPMKESCRVRIGAPSISNGPEGLPWLEEFFARFGGVNESGVDFIPIHYYSDDVEHFKRYVTAVYKQYRKPVWITEFSCTNWNVEKPPSEQDVSNFMKEALAFLDGQEFVERYAWFGAMSDVGDGVGRANGLQKDGKLTEAGKLYTSL
jgi:hypothetical protein